MVFRPGHAHWDFCYLWVAGSQVAVAPADDVTDARWFSFEDLPDLNEHMRALVDAAAAGDHADGQDGDCGSRISGLLAVRVERQPRHRER